MIYANSSIFPMISDEEYIVQSNLDGSNTDGSFTVANSNSFLSPYEILPIAEENKYLRKYLLYHLLPDLASWLTLSGSNYQYLEHISMVPNWGSSHWSSTVHLDKFCS